MQSTSKEAEFTPPDDCHTQRTAKQKKKLRWMALEPVLHVPQQCHEGRGDEEDKPT